METSGGGGAGCLFIIALIFGGLAFFVLTPVGVEQSVAPAVEEAIQAPYPVFALEDIPCGTLITPELTTPYPMEVMINQYTTMHIPAGEEIDPATLSETVPDCSG